MPMTPVRFETQRDIETERGRVVPAGSGGYILAYCRNRKGIAHVRFDGMPPKETVLVMMRQLFNPREKQKPYDN